MAEDTELKQLLGRIAGALERLAPPAPAPVALRDADAFVWVAERGALRPVVEVNAIPIELLVGIDPQKQKLIDNTLRFAQGLPANNVLIWGARGMGKSSLIKGVHQHVNRQVDRKIALVEIHREDIDSLPELLNGLRAQDRPAILFCDDLSFEPGDTSYKSLKAALEGGLEGRPEHVLFYASSNRRHLMPRDMMQNERSTAINPSEAVEESVSLSDRFGLWIGVHHCNQDDFLAMIDGYAAHFGLDIAPEDLHREAKAWSRTRGALSGRVAWQFIQDMRAALAKP